MVAAMPRTPGAAALPAAAAEADLLRQHFGHRARILTGPDATCDSVIRALPEAQWAHFACHSLANLTSPSASCLALSDYLIQPLTVTDIARLRMTDADMAFLSA